MNNYFIKIPNTPPKIRASTTIAHLINGLGFRYYWASENLTDKEYLFSPGNGSMTITALNLHIYDLVIMLYKTFSSETDVKKVTITNFKASRIEILHVLEKLSKLLLTLNDTELENCTFYSHKYEQNFPFWNMLNGPIADVLTHIGQLTSWRRLAGNPQPKGVNVFTGKQAID